MATQTLTSVQIKKTIIARRWRSALIHEGVTTANAQRVTIVMVGTTEQGVLPKNFRCTRSFQVISSIALCRKHECFHGGPLSSLPLVPKVRPWASLVENHWVPFCHICRADELGLYLKFRNPSPILFRYRELENQISSSPLYPKSSLCILSLINSIGLVDPTPQ